MRKPILAYIPALARYQGVNAAHPISQILSVRRTSEATRINKDGLVEQVSPELPRQDWGDGNCPSLLLEPERTNLQVYSEDFDNAVWSKTRCTVTNGILAPDGTLNGTKAECNATGSNTALIDAFNISSGDTVSFSVFVKKGNTQHCSMGLLDSSYASGYRIIFDLDNKEVASENFFGSVFSNTSYTIKEYANGWIRLSVSMDTTGTTLARTYIYPVTDGPTIFSATEGQYNYVWGAQGEVGNYSTSYIKTEATTETRTRDYATGWSGSWINDADLSEGTFFVDVTPANDTSSNPNITLSDATNANRVVFIFYASSNQLRYYLSSNASGSTVNALSHYESSVDVDSRSKLAVTFKDNEFKCYFNGNLVNTTLNQLSCINLSRLDLSTPYDTNNFNGKVHDIRVYDYVLSEEEAIRLTT